jgi:hypothetical protein
LPTGFTAASHPESAEALVRAVHASSYSQIDDVIADPVSQQQA